MTTKLTMVPAFVLALVALPLMASAYTFPSTNADNQNQTVPGRVGQDAPYVEQVDAQPGQTTLRFTNNTNSLAAFESTVDGARLTSGTAHPVTGDFIYPVTAVDGRGIATPVTFDQIFSGESLVEIRLALGGERDWDFDWTSFSIPAPENSGGGSMIPCSGPMAPGWQTGIPGGGCGGDAMHVNPGEGDCPAWYPRSMGCMVN